MRYVYEKTHLLISRVVFFKALWPQAFQDQSKIIFMLDQENSKNSTVLPKGKHTVFPKFAFRALKENQKLHISTGYIVTGAYLPW